MNIYKCIKDIKIFDRIIYSKDQLVDIDSTSDYTSIPFLYIDFNNTEYFEKCMPVYKIGQWVKFKPQALYGYITAFNPKTKKYTVYIEDYNHTKEVYKCDICPINLYYFINTKGQVHRAFVGDNKERDAFTKKTHNQFNTKEEAKKALKKLWEN